MPHNRRVTSGPGAVGRTALALVGLGSVAGWVRAEPVSPLVIEVRAAVAERPKSPRVASAAPMPAGWGKKYGILSVQLVESENDLVEQVDEDALATLLMRELDSHGFRRISAGESPEILLTVYYGRGWLANPYKGQSQTQLGMTNVTSTTSTSMPTRYVSQEVVGFTLPFANEKSAGREARLQKANFEKLYVRVTAWEFPRDPKARAHLLWKTTIFTDDPDHRDLNQVLPAMLAAGVPYFGRETAGAGVEIFPPVAEGHVKVGTPQVVDAPALTVTAQRVGPTTPVAIAAEPRKKFAVPAGAAGETLRTFAQQSDERIIYPVEQILTVKTNGVAGEYSPRAALETMLRGTGLVVVQDEKTGTFIIHQAGR